jgi:hypothetical protein
MPEGCTLAEWRSWVPMDPWLDRLGGHSLAEQRLCVGVPSWAGLRGTALQNEYCAVLCRLWGCSQQSRDHAVLGSVARRDWAPAGLYRPSGVGLAEIVNVCGSLALRLIPQRSCGSEEWEFRVAQPWWGRRAGPEDRRSHGVWSSSYMGLWGRAWRAAPAILLVYGGVQRPPRS